MIVPACPFLRLFSISVGALSLAMLGCGADIPSNGPLAVGHLRGMVHGGSQPISGATIQLYAAGTTGYGTGATALLSTPVTSDASGNFSITGDYTCPSSTSQLYIVGTGGNPGLSPGTNNAASVLMTALGPCTLYGSQYTLNPNSFIFINEATTVASVYALAPFMTPGTTQVGTSSTNTLGLANAFLSVQNLVNTTTGAPLATTPAGNGIVPQAELDTLANILASCVNSNGVSSTCASLQAASTPAGGTAPTNVLQAIYNIATNPASQIAALYALASATVPYQPTLSAAPHDWTVALNYTGGGLSGPVAVSIDSLGDVWIANDNSSVIKLSSNGVILSGLAGFTGGGINRPRGMAIDLSDNAWVANFFGNSVTKLSNSGSILSGTNGFTNGISGVNGPTFVAIDGTGNAWITNSSSPSLTVTKLAGDGSLIAASISPCVTASTCQLDGPRQIAIDASEDVWIANSNPGPGAVAELNGGGTVLSGQDGFTNGTSDAGFIAFDHSGSAWVINTTGDGIAKLDSSGALLDSVNPPGLSEPFGIAIDGSGNAWINDNPSAAVFELSNNLAILSGALGYVDATPVPPIQGCTPPSNPRCIVPRNTYAIAVDGSGNVWVANSDPSISQFIGVATPVVTPLSLGVKNNNLGARP
jgi:streptogramin lyase